MNMQKKDKNDPLLLENQVCFPLYACARRVVNNYAGLLKDSGLTYTQYVTMMVMWEHEKITVKDLGAKLYLDSGTLTPVIKKLCSLGHIKKYRDESDERVVIVEITPQGHQLKEKVKDIPQKICCRISENKQGFSMDDAKQLKELLLKLLCNVD